MVNLNNLWVIFVSLSSVTASFVGVLTGILLVRLFVISLVAGFFPIAWDATLNKIISLKKGG